MTTKIPQDFYAKLSEHFRQDLAKIIVTQVGGEDAFLKLCEQSEDFDMDFQVEGITTDEDVLAFFDKNIEVLFNFTEVSSWDYRHDGGEALVLSSLEDTTYSIDNVMDVMHPEDCDKTPDNELKLKIAKLVTLSATFALVDKYNSYAREKLEDSV